MKYKVSFRLVLIAVLIGVALPLVFAKIAAGATRCCDPCGAWIKVFSYYDEDADGQYDGDGSDGPADGFAVNLYNQDWGLMKVSISGRGDGSWEPGEQDAGWTLFPRLRNGAYYVCHGLFSMQEETQPVPPYDHPSPWVSTVERPLWVADEAPYCYQVVVRSHCDSYKVRFGIYENIHE